MNVVFFSFCVFLWMRMKKRKTMEEKRIGFVVFVWFDGFVGLDKREKEEVEPKKKRMEDNRRVFWGLVSLLV